MPFSVNGFGTGMIRASHKRSFNGLIQFDGIEAFTVLLLPLIPYKVIHVVASDGDRYQALPLRFSTRIILKAFLRSWSIGMLVGGGALGCIAGLAQWNMTRPVETADEVALATSVALVVGGLLARIWWWLLERHDDRLRRLFGATPAGTSDPQDWPEDLAQSIANALLEESGGTTLSDAAFRLRERGEAGKAAVAARLAEVHGEQGGRELLERWMAW